MASASQLRSQVAGLATLAGNDLAALWRRVSTAAEAHEALNDVLPALIDTYGAAAATVAADWYDEARDQQDVARRFHAIPAAPVDGGTESLVGWALHEATDAEAVKVLIGGGLQRRIANYARRTVMYSSLADPGAQGWQRSGAGACDFCLMIISRGAVFTEATADFAAHDSCHCVAVPSFHGRPKPVQAYTPSARRSTADQQRAREWIAAHH